MTHAPFILFYALMGTGLLLAANSHGKVKEAKRDSFWTSFVSSVITMALVFWMTGWRFF